MARCYNQLSQIIMTNEYVFVRSLVTNSPFNDPIGIAVDSSGNVYVADTGNNRIQKFSSDGKFIKMWGSTGTANGQLDYPFGVSVDSSDNVYVTECDNSRIQKFSSDGTFIPWAVSVTPSSIGSGPADEDPAGQFSLPMGVAVDSSGNMYVADDENNRIQKFSSDGKFIKMWGSPGSPASGQLTILNLPEGVAVDSSGNVYVTDTKNNQIQKFSSDGKFIKMWGSSGEANGQFNLPQGIAVDSSGNIYVTEVGNRYARIQKFSSDGKFITTWGEGKFSNPRGVAVDRSGNVYVTDMENSSVQVFAPSNNPSK